VKIVNLQREKVIALLAGVKLRPTRQRVGLGELLFRDDHRHVTAETLHREASAKGFHVSLATVYNTLHQFVEAGLLQKFTLESGRAVFDTNTGFHHHFVCQETGELTDIPAEAIDITKIPLPPEGTEITSIGVQIRTRPFVESFTKAFA
jgi:Fur family transcriptional regulator, iron response regulator